MTSGQSLGPMPDNLAYAVSKGALAGATPSVADALAQQRILLNTINPGPVNTGYLDDAPPELLGDEGEWVVGQVLNSEGGFRR